MSFFVVPYGNIFPVNLAEKISLVVFISVGIIISIVTEALRTNIDELAASNAALAESNSTLDDFVHIVSHDLKEPARGLNAFATMLLEDYVSRLDAEGKQQLETIKKMTMRMQELITDLLRYSVLGREKARFEEVDIKAVVAGILELMEAQIEEENVQISIDENLPKIYCSKAHLSEVFRNLITNGLKYNNSDPKKIEIGFLSRHKDYPDHIIFFVRDNGIGIPKEHRESVFRMFKRLHGRDKYGGGTGSGLAIVKCIVDQHNGKIWVDSKEGEGSTFYFYVDCA